MTTQERWTLAGTAIALLYLAWTNREALSTVLSSATIAAAIGQVESGGHYDALGPWTVEGDRAYGKYQVLGANVGPWSQRAIGRALTPDEFLADARAQDAVAHWKIDQLWLKFQNVGDVAAVWFSGQPLAVAAARSDVTGTTVQAYVDRVLAVLA